MTKITTFALAGFATLFLLGARTRAETPAADAKPDKPAATAEVKPAAVAPPLTDDALKTMLENMGYETKAETAGKAVIYHLKFEQDDWTFYIDVALSSDKEQLWISTNVATVPADATVPAETFLRLLEESDKIGPSSVSYSKSSKRISVVRALTNRGGLTAAVLRTHLNQFLGDAKDVMKLCDFPKPADKAETKTETKTEGTK